MSAFINLDIIMIGRYVLEFIIKEIYKNLFLDFLFQFIIDFTLFENMVKLRDMFC